MHYNICTIELPLAYNSNITFSRAQHVVVVMLVKRITKQFHQHAVSYTLLHNYTSSFESLLCLFFSNALTW